MKRGHLNRSVDIRNSTNAFNMSLLTAKLQLRLTYRNVWINQSSLWDEICLLIFLILFMRVFLGVWKSALLFQYHYHTHKIDLEYLENIAYICDCEGDWGLDAILLGVWFPCVLWTRLFSCDVGDIQKDIFEGKPPQNLDFK